MWGRSGRFYWAPPPAQPSAGGIVVALAPACGATALKLRPLTELYAALGWRCLVCLADIFSLYFPEKMTTLACDILRELVKELKVRCVPVVLASYSAGSVGCFYKIVQLLDGQCEVGATADAYQLVRDCLCGQIYDSSPVEFVSGLTTKLLNPGVNISRPERLLLWTAKALESGMDTFFPSRMEALRAEYWQTLYSTSGIGPCLILCSRDDQLAPCHILSSFSQRLRDIGSDVKLLKWSDSDHLGHYSIHEAEYRNAVTELLSKAFSTFKRRQGLAVSSSLSREVSESELNIYETAMCSNERFKGVEKNMSEAMLHSSSDATESSALEMFQSPRFKPQGVLSQVLYDVCVPKNIEEWDIKLTMPLKSSKSPRLTPLKPIRCFRRARL